MTYLEKMIIELQEIYDIEYHYNKYKSQRRLIIDRIDDLYFSTTQERQKIAKEQLKILYNEYILVINKTIQEVKERIRGGK